MGKHPFHASQSGLDTRVIAIVKEKNITGKTVQEVNLIRSQGGSQGGY